MANTVLPGYETVMANKKVVIVDHTGQTSYNNTGTFATSGETILASDFGLGGFDYIQADMISNDGLNYAQIVPTTAGAVGGVAVPSAVLHWYVLATNAEVANAQNMSTKCIRLFIIGV